MLIENKLLLCDHRMFNTFGWTTDVPTSLYIYPVDMMY